MFDISRVKYICSPAAGIPLKFSFICLFVLYALIFSLQTAFAQQPVLKKVSLVTLWRPQAQFAGYYLAQEKGFFRKYGLDVNILDAGPGKDPLELLRAGKADFAVLWLSSALQGRSKGLDLVNIGQLSQRSALMLLARKSSGIYKPADFRGKRVGLWQGDLRLPPEVFFREYGLEVEIVPQSYSVNLFLRGGVDAVSAMWYNEYDTVINSGVDPDELSLFLFSEYGINFPEDGIYALSVLLEKDPQAAKDFFTACLEGWQYAFQHQEETVDLVIKRMKSAHLPANRGHQRWMLRCMKELMGMSDPAYITGNLDKEDYLRVARELLGKGLIEKIPDFDSFYRR